MKIKTYSFLIPVFTILLALSTSTIAYSQNTTNKPMTNESSRSSDNNSSSQNENQNDKITSPQPVLMMVPIEVSTDAEKKGCWVRLYDEKNYGGDGLMVTGPISFSRMIGPFGFDWENKVRSLQTGPKTNLIIFDNRDFLDHNKFISESKGVPDMSKNMGFFDDFRSMKVTCIDDRMSPK